MPWFRCENGLVLEMDLPLHEGIAQRVEQGLIRRVGGPDGEPYEGEPDDAPAPPTKRPADSARKAEWVAWAVACGADPDRAAALPKGDLIDQYGNKTPEEA